jgi:hypothetical protein
MMGSTLALLGLCATDKAMEVDGLALAGRRVCRSTYLGATHPRQRIEPRPVAAASASNRAAKARGLNTFYKGRDLSY